MKKSAPLVACVLFAIIALRSTVDAQVPTTTKRAFQVDLGTPYQWARQESPYYRSRPLRFSAEYLHHLHSNHRWSLTIDADYTDFRYGYAFFQHQGRNYRTFVHLKHIGLYAGLRAYLFRFPWQFDNGLFVEPQLGLAYELGKENTPNVQLLPRPQFVRLDWRLRLGMVFPLSHSIQLSPSLEYLRMVGPYSDDVSPKLLAELNLGFKF